MGANGKVLLLFPFPLNVQRMPRAYEIGGRSITSAHQKESESDPSVLVLVLVGTRSVVVQSRTRVNPHYTPTLGYLLLVIIF